MAVAPSNFATAELSTVSITINLGDLVLVMINNADGTQPSGLTDSSGVNVYGLVGIGSNYAGSGVGYSGFSAVYCCSNAQAATSVSFAAGHAPSIAVGTLTGATGTNPLAAIQPGTNGTALSQAITTKRANSYVVAFVSFDYPSSAAYSVSAVTGTLTTSASATGAIDGVGVIRLAAATAGSYTPAVLANTGVYWEMVAVEVWSGSVFLGEGQPSSATHSNSTLPLLAGPAAPLTSGLNPRGVTGFKVWAAFNHSLDTNPFQSVGSYTATQGQGYDDTTNKMPPNMNYPVGITCPANFVGTPSYLTLAWMSPVLRPLYDFGSLGLLANYVGQLFPHGGNAPGPGQVFPY